MSQAPSEASRGRRPRRPSSDGALPSWCALAVLHVGRQGGQVAPLTEREHGTEPAAETASEAQGCGLTYAPRPAFMVKRCMLLLMLFLLSSCVFLHLIYTSWRIM